MSEVETPRLTEEAIQQIAAIREDLPPDVCDEFTGSERNALARHDLCRRCRYTQATHDLKFLLGVIDLRLHEQLQTVLGALADIATLSEGEIADGVAQRKAKRIYNEARGRKPDEPID